MNSIHTACQPASVSGMHPQMHLLTRGAVWWVQVHEKALDALRVRAAALHSEAEAALETIYTQDRSLADYMDRTRLAVLFPKTRCVSVCVRVCVCVCVFPCVHSIPFTYLTTD